MNRRNFALTLASTAGAAILGPAGLQASIVSLEAAPGWSSASAAALLKGARFSIEGVEGSTLELIDIETYKSEDGQYFAGFRTRGGLLSEGTYRLHGPAGAVDFYLQPRDEVGELMEAAVCHARG